MHRRLPTTHVLPLLAALALTPAFVLAQTAHHKSGDQTKDEAQGDADAGEHDTLVAFPHPLITEILFAVPSGDSDGDADLSGTRSATGDEFIELVNPHDKPINLKGYRLVDGQPVAGPGSRDTRATGGGGNKTQQEKDPRRGMGAKKSVGPEDMPYSKPKQKTSEPAVKNPTTSVRGRTNDRSRLDFTFPEMILDPGETVVVFNGYKSDPAGSNAGLVGDAKKAADKNGTFGGAHILTMRCTSMYQALSNREDMIVLLASDGRAVDTIRWGPTADDGTPAPKDKRSPVRTKSGLEEWVPTNCVGSVQRTSLTDGFSCHMDLNGELMSPGVYTPMQPRESDAAKTDEAAPVEEEEAQPPEEETPAVGHEPGSEPGKESEPEPK